MMSTLPFSDVDDFDLNLLLNLQQNDANSMFDEQYEYNISNTINNNL